MQVQETATATVTLDGATPSNATAVTITGGGSGWINGEAFTIPSQSLGYGIGLPLGTDATGTVSNADIVNGPSFILETFSEGTIMNSVGAEGANNTLVNGTSDNFRWEIVNPNSASGVFSVVLRRGDDNINSQTVLETFTNCSLDPKADNYISKVIGDTDDVLLTDGDGVTYIQPTGNYPNASRYIRVKEVIEKTPNYFDNNGDPKDEYTGSIPIAASGTFSGGNGDLIPLGRVANYYQNINTISTIYTDTQGLEESDYDTALSVLNNKDAYIYNMITAPGCTLQSNSSVCSTMIAQGQSRGDNLAIVDLRDFDATVLEAVNGAATQDSSYVATYWPWVQTTDPNMGDLIWVPASTMMPAVMAYNDRVSATWFAPAGINRGGMGTVTRAERKLTQSQRDDLYTANINPIGTFPNSGVVVFGQKTMQKKSSALDRVNVRRLLITLKSYISQIADTLVFEQNTIATRNSFLSQVNPYLENVQQQQGLYAFKVTMDESNNTPDVVDRNEMKGAIYLQPTKTAEFIYLDFNVTPTGATFPA